MAELLGQAAATDEFLDRWRVPGATESLLWEDRFGEEVYVPLARSAFDRALARAGLTASDVDHLVVGGLHSRAVASVKRSLSVPAERVAPDHSALVGNLGAAQCGLALADVLERATAGQVVAVVEVADGADAVVLRTTDALAGVQAARQEAGIAPVADLVNDGRSDLAYAVFLSWRGMLRREPPRRPDPERPDAPAVHRSEGWKFGFDASRCQVCGFRHLPPTRICLSCQSVDQMVPERMADLRGTVATYTVDRLAFSLSPPMVGAVIDFDGGGRYRGEMTDVDPDAVGVGTRVDMTFRRLYSAQGVHNYFWKARPLPEGPWPRTPPRSRRRRTSDMSSTGIRDRVAIVGMGCTPFGELWDKGINDLLTDAAVDCSARPVWPSTPSTPSGWAPWGRGIRVSPCPSRSRSTTNPSPGWRISAPPVPRPSATPATRWPRVPTNWPWPSGWRS